ncbi:MAG: sulfur oxidation protein [Sulfuricurvum sp. PC08-66]|nr:MAG: sulfur oxidation protein [Sulfuricurvum sp. PC08-66]
MNRRNFLKVVASSTALVAVSPALIRGNLYAADGTLYRAYEKVQLVDAEGKPIKVSALNKEVSYVFNYPHASTPSILLNLPNATQKNVELVSESGEKYVWESGVGANRSVVAYVAICTHQLTHPSPGDSFFSYVPNGQKTIAIDRSGVVLCASHLSAFDPAAGGKVLGGPATQPLNAVVLEHAADDTLWAVGVLGSDRFQDYFKTFRPELKEYYGGPAKAKQLVSISAKTVKLTEYSKEVIQY